MDIPNRSTVLLVEDEALLAVNEKSLLEKNGFAVISVSNAAQAIEAIDKTKIDLILMDVDVGPNKQDGTQAAESIVEHHDIPIVFLSSHVEPEIVKRTERITSYGYITKNCGETVLIASITMAFKLHEAHKERIRKSNQLDALLDNAEDYIGRLDRNKRHLYVNRALCLATGIPFKEYIGKTIDELGYPRELSEKWNSALNEVFTTGEARRIEFSFPAQDGEKFLDCKIVPERVEEGSVLTVVAISRDITDLKRTEEVLYDSERKFRSLVENTSDWVWQVDREGKYVYSSDNTEKMIGYSPEQLLGKSPFELMTEEEAERVGPYYAYIFQQRERILGLEDTLIHKDGRPIIFETNATPLYDKEGAFQGYFGTCRDITERKIIAEQLQKSEHQKNLILNSTTELVAYYDTELKIIWCNKASADSVGRTPDDLVGLYCYEVWQDRDLPCPDCPVIKALKEKEPWGAEQQTPDGRYWSIRGYPVLDNSGEVTALVEFGQDISDRKEAEEALKNSLEEKEFLLKELNHRIKNNLAMISSLINLKNVSIGETVDLSDIVHQIDAIRIVHEKLHQSDKITHIEFHSYIQELLSTVFSTFTIRPVKIDNNINNVTIRTRTAIALGLIINEIATNAIKHGFSEKEALFTIDLKTSLPEKRYVLTVSNSGKPFPEEVSLDAPETLGLRLISALVEQLDGKIDLQRKPFPVFSITFPTDD